MYGIKLFLLILKSVVEVNITISTAGFFPHLDPRAMYGSSFHREDRDEFPPS
jgi:hypothetical protein